MLDLRRLRAAVLRLDAPGTGTCTWTDGARAEIDFSSPRLTVTVRIWEGFAKGYVPVTFEVQTDTTPCHCGKTRTWLICPGCGRRRVTLAVNYQAHKLACPACSGLSYETQSMSRRARIERMLEMLRHQLERGRRS